MELKDIYDHTRDNLHYYVKWRERILAGHFAVLVALAFMLRWMLDKQYRKAYFCPFLIAAAASLFFSVLDRRNREQYRACFAVGAALEEQFGRNQNLEPELVKKISLYKHLGAMTDQVSHSLALDIMYGALVALLILAAVYCACRAVWLN